MCQQPANKSVQFLNHQLIYSNYPIKNTPEVSDGSRTSALEKGDSFWKASFSGSMLSCLGVQQNDLLPFPSPTHMFAGLKLCVIGFYCMMTIPLTHLPNLGVVDVILLKEICSWSWLMVIDHRSMIVDLYIVTVVVVVVVVVVVRTFPIQYPLIFRDILSGGSFTNVLRVLVKILTHFVLVMSGTVCNHHLRMTDWLGYCWDHFHGLGRIGAMTWRYKSEKHISHFPKLREV